MKRRSWINHPSHHHSLLTRQTRWQFANALFPCRALALSNKCFDHPDRTDGSKVSAHTAPLACYSNSALNKHRPAHHCHHHIKDDIIFNISKWKMKRFWVGFTLFFLGFCIVTFSFFLGLNKISVFLQIAWKSLWDSLPQEKLMCVFSTKLYDS